MNALKVKNLTKRYPAFTLDGVTFSVEEGRVCALVGANGAGKTTTLKSITGLISSEGEVGIFNRDLRTREREAKELLGYVGGGFRYYPQKTLAAVSTAVSRFYEGWQSEKFSAYLKKYNLDPRKKISALSDGMKVKFYLSLALSHGARLLILDEPTSGLDPLSREEFCDTVLSLVREEGVSVLFSTHITSDAERIADDVVLLSDGKVLLDGVLSEIKTRYLTAFFRDVSEAKQAGALGVKPVKDGYEGLVPCGEAQGLSVRAATLDDVIIHLELERRGA